ncbi:MAG TPA: hypothetical protein VFF52_24715 [Isosphaeraceae bacterium]|nr:hypothetical protein [Isosphaeraceae bacterium]
MTAPTNISAIGPLVLVRLLAAGEKGETGSKVKKDLEPLLAHRWSGVTLVDALNRTHDELEAAGLVASLPGKTRKAAPKIALTVEGRRRGLEFLGLDAMPVKPKPTWTNLKKIWLVARAMGLGPLTDQSSAQFAKDDGFKGALLRQQFQLPTSAIPKLDVATDALAWKLIGFEGVARKFDAKSVKTALLNRALGDGRPTDFKKAASRLVAHRSGARRDDPKELRDAVLRGWIDRISGPSEPGGAQEPPALSVYRPATPEPQESPPGPPPAGKPPLELSALAERVKAAARACPTGRFGANKVFVAHVWKELRSDPDFAGMDLDEFKEFLGLANNFRLLDLARADLVQAMDPEDVRLSEVRYLNATFHFIRI